MADSVIDSAVSERQTKSVFSWMTVSRPGNDLTMRWVASAAPPSGSLMSVTLAGAAPRKAGDCAELRSSRIRLLSPGVTSIGTRARMR